MGVAGSGKTTVGTHLARSLQLPFVDADALHSAGNVEKMRRGEPLTDADREPWLAAVAHTLADAQQFPRGVIVACSALKADYRQRLRSASEDVIFLFLAVPAQLAARRVESRPAHFMPARLVPDQFAVLERPTPAERDVIEVDASRPLEDVVSRLTARLAGRGVRLR